MNAKHLASGGDIRPLEFALAVILGGLGSALLSGLQKNPWVSVGFALLVMSIVAFLRWRIARESNDYLSLEAFAEDIYLLGYLLTLAALLGLAPRLMSEESNLFHIAGVKLFTTMFGLGLMMIFRQTARRWAEMSAVEDEDKFLRQEELFRGAVGRLNQAASELTGKMEEVALRFDPDLLGPVAEWSNRAANAFSAATRAFDQVPASTDSSVLRMNEFGKELERVKTAVTELATLLATNVGAASSEFARELGQAGLSAKALAGTVATLQPTTEASRSALERLGSQALQEVSRFGELNLSLSRIAGELGKVEETMKKFAVTDTADMNAPINRLIHALEAATEKAAVSSEQMEVLKGGLEGSVRTSQEREDRFITEIGNLLTNHAEALQRVHEQLLTESRQIGHVPPPAEGAVIDVLPREGFEKQLLSGLNETNAQLGALVRRIDGAAEMEHKPGILGRLFGSGAGPSTK